MTYPGDTVAGQYPDDPVLRDEGFHLHLQCGRPGLHAVVAAAGTMLSGSSGASVTRVATGLYEVSFTQDISGVCPCCHSPQLQNTRSEGDSGLSFPRFVRTDGHGLDEQERPGADAGRFRTRRNVYRLVRHHSQERWVLHSLHVPGAAGCGFTGSFYKSTAGTAPGTQGYVATWYADSTTGGIQTKNGGYGIQSGSSVDIVATC